eukprot:9475211-Pyramimonas_sp.AAC.1
MQDVRALLGARVHPPRHGVPVGPDHVALLEPLLQEPTIVGFQLRALRVARMARGTCPPGLRTKAMRSPSFGSLK